jgi:pantoate--beta-alanine ligase
MQKIESVAEMRALAARWKQEGKSVAFVPTSGALHAGHAGLVDVAKTRGQIVVVSCFVNPLAFGPSENFAGYPRTSADDEKFCTERGVDVLFAPATEELFPRGHSTYVTEEAVSKPLCGVSRPTHFRGVTTGIAKLLNIVRPEVLVLGQRDAQQVAVLRKMIADLCFGVEIAVAPTVRDPDGMATTLRTRGLTTNQRNEALAIHAALQRAKEMAQQGVRSPDRIIAEATHLLGERRRVRVIYVAIVDPHTMEPLREVVPGRALLAIAAWIDEVRLIDNIEL